MILRSHYLHKLEKAINRAPIVSILGPRQVGKTTLARQFVGKRDAVFFDLELESDRLRLANPELVLGSARGIVVIDEIQVMPNLFQTLRVLVDRPNSARYLILGSASPDIIRGASETLAGRVEFVELMGFGLEEIGAGEWRKLWLRGGFPRSFLAKSEEDSYSWRENFLRTFLERDLPQLGIFIPPVTLQRFWRMLAHYHGQYFNASELARGMALSNKTIRSYLDILTGVMVVRQLQPWFINIKKRQVRSPKVYIRDTGLLHALLQIRDEDVLWGHPVVGASWEGFVIEELHKLLRPYGSYFWATQAGAELDLLFAYHGRNFGVEVKFTEAPATTKSMHIVIDDLNLSHLWVIHPGPHTYPMTESISALSINDLLTLPGLVDAQSRR